MNPHPWRRRTTTLTVLLATIATLGLVQATPAHANIPCPAAYVCTYQNDDFGGQMYYYTGPFNTCIPIGAPWTNMISSVINNKSIPVRLYYNICSSNLWNKDVAANSNTYAIAPPLNDHVHSMWIGFAPPR